MKQDAALVAGIDGERIGRSRRRPEPPVSFFEFWPGWLFYASVNFGPSGGLWHDVPVSR